MTLSHISVRSQPIGDYVVLHSGDTIVGRVAKLGYGKISVGIGNGKTARLKADKVHYFRKEDKEFYSVRVPDLNSNSLYKVEFLKLLVGGYLKLLVQDKTILNTNPTMPRIGTEIHYSTSYYLRIGENNNDILINNIDDLLKYVSDNQALVSRISNRDFKRGDIELVVIEYNKWVAEELAGR